MLETINERIKHVLDTLYKGNVTAMAKATYIKRTTLSSIVGADGNTPGFDVIMKIAEITSHPISMEWLIRGSGDMFLGEKIQSVDEFINRLEEYIAYWNNERISPALGQELKTL